MKVRTVIDCLLDMLLVTSQAEIARQLGTSRQHVHTWLTGVQKPSAKYCDKIVELHRKVMKKGSGNGKRTVVSKTA